MSWESIARAYLEGFKTSADITYLTDLSRDELIAKLSSLPERSIILYVWQRARNSDGNFLESGEFLDSIAPSARAPIYGMSWANVGRGIVGGYVWTMETQAAKVAELVLRVANGARAADIPVENAPVIPMFDWRQLQRWDIDENRLPDDSVIHFRELSTWERYNRPLCVAGTPDYRAARRASPRSQGRRRAAGKRGAFSQSI